MTGGLLRTALAVVSGFAVYLAFPDNNLWWLAPVGIAGLALATLRTSPPLAFMLGLVGGLGCFAPVLSWSGTYVGDLPWLALAVLESLYVAAMCAVVVAIQNPLWRAGHRFLAYAVIPLGWVVGEWARSTTPFGGFPWARLALSQADSPLAALAAWGAAPGVSFAVAGVGVVLAAVVVAIHERRLARSALLLLAAVLVIGAPRLIVLPTDGPRESVALIQGNVPQAGLDFNAQRRAVLDNHVRGTLALAKDRPDDLALVIWPENASDIDPLRNADAADQVQKAISAVKAPLIVGAVLDGPGENVRNASLFYPAPGIPPQEYIKVHPVPFGEYIPYRSFFRLFSAQVDLVSRDFVPGDRMAAFAVGSGTAAFNAIPTICFEVAYDDVVRDAVREAGNALPSLLVVQTNNATFGYTAESTQQLAISRIQAITHGRSVAHVSTVGVSAFIAPDGTLSSTTSLFTPAQVVVSPVLRRGTTVADWLGPLPNYAATGALLLLAGVAARSHRRRAATARVLSARSPEKGPSPS